MIRTARNADAQNRRRRAQFLHDRLRALDLDADGKPLFTGITEIYEPPVAE